MAAHGPRIAGMGVAQASQTATPPPEPAECWCCGVAMPCRCELSGKCEECGWCTAHCRCFRERNR